MVCLPFSRLFWQGLFYYLRSETSKAASEIHEHTINAHTRNQNYSITSNSQFQPQKQMDKELERQNTNLEIGIDLPIFKNMRVEK